MTLWGRPQEVTVGRPQDVKFQRPKDVGRGRLQDVGRELPWGYIEDHIGTSIRCLLGTSSERPWEVILPNGLLLIYMIKLNMLLCMCLCLCVLYFDLA